MTLTKDDFSWDMWQNGTEFLSVDLHKNTWEIVRDQILKNQEDAIIHLRIAREFEQRIIKKNGQLNELIPIVERLEKRIKVIECNITGADKRIHPEIYKIVMSELSSLQKILDGKK